jgi:hypothetical protein
MADEKVPDLDALGAIANWVLSKFGPTGFILFAVIFGMMCFFIGWSTDTVGTVRAGIHREIDYVYVHRDMTPAQLGTQARQNCGNPQNGSAANQDAWNAADQARIRAIAAAAP